MGRNVELGTQILTALNSIPTEGVYASLNDTGLDYERAVKNMNGSSTTASPGGDKRDYFRSNVQGRKHIGIRSIVEVTAQSGPGRGPCLIVGARAL